MTTVRLVSVPKHSSDSDNRTQPKKRAHLR